MNKTTAMLSGVLVMLGIVVTFGVIARTTETTGMIKKGIHTMPAGRSEYKYAPMSDLNAIDKALKDTMQNLNLLTIKRDSQLPTRIQEVWDVMTARHIKIYNASNDATYLKAKQALDEKVKSTIEAVTKKLAELKK
jgi:hypothetical protein